jgi:hypothetical protein
MSNRARTGRDAERAHMRRGGSTGEKPSRWSRPRYGSSLVRSVLAISVFSLPSLAVAATIVRSITNEAQLVQLFTDADADPANAYQGNLSPRVYRLTTTLSLTKGKVVLRGSTTFAGAAQYVLDCQYRPRDFDGGPKSSTCVDNLSDGRVLRIQRAAGYTGILSVQLWGINVTGGYSTTLNLRGGGGAWVEDGHLEIHDSRIHHNKASQWGAGLLAGNDASLLVINSQVDSNDNEQIDRCGPGMTSIGGGIGVLAGASAHISNSSVTRNKACRGAGIAVTGSATNPTQLSIYNSTVSSNLANYQGGGVLAWGTLDRLEVAFSTIAHNRGGVGSNGQDGTYGGGIAFRDFAVGAASTFTPPIRMWGTVLANNALDFADSFGADCGANSTSTLAPAKTGVASNFIGKNGGCSSFLNFDSSTGGTTLVGTESNPLDPKLAALTNTAAHPDVHVPLANSPVLSEYAGGNRSRNLAPQPCAARDILNQNRGASPTSAPTHCDIGAYERSSCFATSFTALTLAPGWSSNASSGGVAAAALDCDDQVQLKGAISTSGTNAQVFTLPVNLRPQSEVYVPVTLCGAAKGRLRINPSTGAVTVAAEGGAWSNARCFTSLDGVSFALNSVGFTALTLINNWTTPFGLRKAAFSTKGGITRLQGAITTVGTNTNMAPFTLPAGSRPATDTYVNVDMCAGTKGRLLISPAGTVTIQPAGSVISNAQCFTSLEGVWFALTSTGYTTQSLLNSWTHAPFSTRNASVSVEAGVVRFQGAVSTFQTNMNPHIFTLPSGAKPSVTVRLPVGLCDASIGRINIDPSGSVFVEAEGGATTNATCFTSLEGVRFGR